MRSQAFADLWTLANDIRFYADELARGYGFVIQRDREPCPVCADRHYSLTLLPLTQSQ